MFVAVFIYSKAFHNVLQVSAADYTSCNTGNPTMMYATGNDTIPIKAGMNYFICGTPTHCPAGQKIAVNASGSTVPPSAPSPSGSSCSVITPLQALAAVTLSVLASIALDW